MTAIAPGIRRGSWLDRVVDARGDLRAIAILRALLGVIVIRHLWPDLRANVTPVERFHAPLWSWLPTPTPGLYRMLAFLGVAAAAAMVTGLAARFATRVAFALVSYLLFVDLTGFAHNRGFLVWLLFGMSLIPGRISLRPRLHRHTTEAFELVGPLWPVTLLRVVVSSVYLTSGLTKLANPDWRSGLVLWDRMNRHHDLIPFDGWLRETVTSRAFHHVLSPASISVEVFVGLALWRPRTRLVAVWVAFVFHASIELSASVQTFSYSAVAALLMWATPRAGDRTLVASARFARIVRRLDWLGRFHIDVTADLATPTTLFDRDGAVRRGRAAQLTALSRLPLLFPIVAPMLAGNWLRDQTSGLIRRRSGSLAHDLDSSPL